MRCPPASRASSPGGHGGAPVVVGVDGDNDVLPAVEMLAHVLNLLGIDVGHGHLHGGGEVDDLPFRPGLPDVDDRVADPQGKLHLRAGEALREYSKRKLVSGILSAYSLNSLAPRAAMSTISSSAIRKTCCRWAKEVEL